MPVAELTTASLGREHSVRWKWLLALGIGLLLLGLTGAGASTLLELTSLLVFGPLLLASSSRGRILVIATREDVTMFREVLKVLEANRND